ncbi:MAG: glycosyltransferase [Saprospiraceae bacterium]|nr:glycosyltransferase [Saprospiraceae bacterium]
MITDVIIPVLNEEKSIAKVIDKLPKHLFRNIVVCDNGSIDNTARVASRAGAIVVHEPHKGYGSACLKALDYIHTQSILPEVVLFIDGDYSDYPEESESLLLPIFNNTHDIVIGSRALGNAEKGSLTTVQLFGNKLASLLITVFYNLRITDLGPFRAIRFSALQKLNMKDRDFGWTVEMQLKAAKLKIRYLEVPVSYRKRVGESKISGTIIGSIKAGYKILYTIFKLL